MGSQAALIVFSRSFGLVSGATHFDSISMFATSLKSLPITATNILPI